jgi:hypothetical protein
MARQDTKLESEGAEFLVLGQLLIEGIPAYKAYTNLRGYDLVAVAPETNHSARIQVKSRWATDANHFLIKKFDCDFVVLVRLNRGYRFSGAVKRALDQKADPEFYVLSVKDALSIAKTGTWSKIVWDTEKFEGHRRRWNIIREFLRKPGSKNQ